MKGFIIKVDKRTPVTGPLLSTDRPKQGLLIGELVSSVHQRCEARSCPLRPAGITEGGWSKLQAINQSVELLTCCQGAKTVTYARSRRKTRRDILREPCSVVLRDSGRKDRRGRKSGPRSSIGNGGEESDNLF